MFLRLAPRWRRWRKEQRTVTLDFGCDEGRDLPDMLRLFVIFVNVHVKGQWDRHLLGQYRLDFLFAVACCSLTHVGWRYMPLY